MYKGMSDDEFDNDSMSGEIVGTEAGVALVTLKTCPKLLLGIVLRNAVQLIVMSHIN